MGLQYRHLLIPDHPEFVPKSADVAAFLDDLVSLHSAPLEATIRVGKLSGEFLTGTDPLTGNEISVPRREFLKVEAISQISSQLAGVDDYITLMEGMGPPKLAPFSLYTIKDSVECKYDEPYWYGISCNLRAEVVSTCETPPFEIRCRPGTRLGIFRDPRTGATIQVADAGCARFWIEFEFGKWIFPRVNGDLTLLHPSIVNLARNAFGRSFAQCCFWG